MTKKHMITMAIIITLWFVYTVIMYGIFPALLSLAFGAGAIILWSKAASFFGRVDNFLKKQELPDEQERAKERARERDKKIADQMRSERAEQIRIAKFIRDHNLDEISITPREPSERG